MDACEIVQDLDDNVLDDERHWIKGARQATKYDSHTVARCMIGALSYSCGGSAFRGYENSRVYNEVRDAMCQAIDELDKEEWYGHKGQTTTVKIIAFNDTDTTTFEDVKAVLRRAKEILCS